MRIIVVRHGLAEAKKGWKGHDADRPLVARGRRQAARLGKVIGTSRPRRVISSPALRCVQTARPLADKLGLGVELSDQLATDAGPAALQLCRRLLSWEAEDSVIMLCTHREVLVQLLPQLSREFDGKLTHRPPGAKGGAWIVRVQNGVLYKIDYHPPAA